MPTELERALADHAAEGRELDLAGEEAVNEAAMRAWGADRTVSAASIRAIVCAGSASGSSDDGPPAALKLRGARVTGRIDLDHVHSPMPLELVDCLLAEGISALDAELPALLLGDCVVEHRQEIPLKAPLLRVRFLGLSRTQVRGRCDGPAAALWGSEIGHLVCSGATFVNLHGCALDMNQARIEHSALMNERFKAAGRGRDGWPGAVNLSGVSVGGLLDFSGATLESTDGTALQALSLHTGLPLVLGRGFKAGVEGSDACAVLLSGATIEELVCEGVELTSSGGPALMADHLTVRGSVVFTDSVLDAASERFGALWLGGAEAGGELRCHGTRMENKSGAALAAPFMKARLNVALGDELDLRGGGDAAALNLRGAHVDGSLIIGDHVALAHRRGPRHRLDVNGLTYTDLEGRGRHDWLTYLYDGTATYAAQPYRQLAGLCHQRGHDKEARSVLVAQQKDRLRRDHVGLAERAWGGLTGMVLGYGYKPWRAIFYLLGVVALAVTLAVVLGAHGGVAREADTAGAHHGPCSVVETVSIGLQLALPLARSAGPQDCTVASGAAGQALTASGWVLQALSWAFATLFVAGFTGAVRRT
ncbi:hypothetical protein V2W30_35530 [Streptomyces sp. Q6]|uniref:Uncharacterized protein n=1 Tax=Streptomyces citrinus TaxID=3118173 RepID=A0ACD5AMJ1_9ACTN